jgi:Immunity protein 7
MFEWHGWATVRVSAGIEDDQAAEEEQRAAERRVAALINEATGADNETVDVRDANGSIHVWLAGSHNHRDDGVVDLFRTLAEAAPGSYGVMYVLDDDASSNWQRWVMRHITQEADTSLSRHVGLVEDPEP